MTRSLLTALLLVTLALGACDRAPAVPENTAAREPVDSPIHQIALPHNEPDMPDGPNRQTFLDTCIVCHSPRYITMQPDFPRHQWEETVSKMVKDYGAHADEKQQREIVDYLVAIRGKKSPEAKP